MQQLGHTDPAFTLRVYGHVMRYSEGERGRLKALVEGAEWEETKAGKGRNAESDTTDVALASGVKGENPRHDAVNE